ncbi:hypothetical protein ACLOJK_004977 [Asimina triloba]
MTIADRPAPSRSSLLPSTNRRRASHHLVGDLIVSVQPCFDGHDQTHLPVIAFQQQIRRQASSTARSASTSVHQPPKSVQQPHDRLIQASTVVRPCQQIHGKQLRPIQPWPTVEPITAVRPSFSKSPSQIQWPRTISRRLAPITMEPTITMPKTSKQQPTDSPKNQALSQPTSTQKPLSS